MEMKQTKKLHSSIVSIGRGTEQNYFRNEMEVKTEPYIIKNHIISDTLSFKFCSYRDLRFLYRIPFNLLNFVVLSAFWI